MRSPGGPGVDEIVVEEPLDLRVDDRSMGILMRTPGHDDELLAGWLLTEGVIEDRDDLIAVGSTHEHTVRAVLAAGVDRSRLDAVARDRFASSACGVCGRAGVERAPPPFDAAPDLPDLLLEELPDRLRAAQALFRATGGSHAAALVLPDGSLEVVREDVGRHNAVDKVIGWRLLDGRVPLDDVTLLVSSRAGYEIVQKAAMAGVRAVIAVGAASSLAVELARRQRITLVGFLREGRATRYV